MLFCSPWRSASSTRPATPRCTRYRGVVPSGPALRSPCVRSDSAHTVQFCLFLHSGTSQRCLILRGIPSRPMSSVISQYTTVQYSALLVRLLLGALPGCPPGLGGTAAGGGVSGQRASAGDDSEPGGGAAAGCAGGGRQWRREGTREGPRYGPLAPSGMPMPRHVVLPCHTQWYACATPLVCPLLRACTWLTPTL